MGKSLQELNPYFAFGIDSHENCIYFSCWLEIGKPDRHDQVGASTIKEASRVGAEFSVLGRPIMQREGIVKAIERVFVELQ